MIDEDVIERFAVATEEPIAVTALTLELVLYFDTELYAVLDTISALLDDFDGMAPQAGARFYRSESMRNFKTTKSVPSKFVKNWSSGTQKKKLRFLSYFYDEPSKKLDGYSLELRNLSSENRILKRTCNYARFVFPPTYSIENFLEFSLQCAKALSFMSGHGGFSIHNSLYETNRAMDQALRFGLRYVALDISALSSSARAVRHDCIKGIYWLTIIGKDLAKRLDLEIEAASFANTGCAVTTVPAGWIIQCGEEPTLGDRNRGESVAPYVAAYERLEAAMANLVASHPPLNSIDNLDAKEITERWLMRLRDISE